MNALPVEKPRPMTVAEFMGWRGDGLGTRYELIAGEPVAQAFPSARHDAIVGNLTTAANIALRDRPPCMAVPGAGIARSLRHHNARGSDLAITCKPIVGTGLLVPTVVFEVLSPSNRADTLAKLPFYAGIDSIQEIVMVESERAGVTVYRRAAGTDWTDAPAETLEAGETLVLRSVDVSIPLADIYRLVPL